MINFKKLKYILIIAFGILIMGHATLAARLYLEPAQGNFDFNSVVRLSLKLDTQGECINAVESGIILPRGVFDVVGISTGNSILSLWVVPPALNDKQDGINFIGGIPGGYCGTQSAVEGSLMEVFLKPKSENISSYIIELDSDSKVLAHDGYGSPLSVKLSGAQIDFSQTGEPAVNQWLQLVELDTVPPEQFIVEVVRDSSLFGGQAAAIFSTSDKQSGLDHYEVREINQKGLDPVTNKLPVWRVASSPYLLADQSLSSLIQVQAVDKAGNARLAEFYPEGFKLSDRNMYFKQAAMIIGVFIILLILVVLKITFKHLHNHRQPK